MLGRRVVQMTPRCLARFQAFPDWYELPESKSLACRIIGNAVPPLAMRTWIRHWLKHP
jgi:site-specific DNA-cytosine methylase